MEIIPTPIKDLVVIQPKVFGDDRGWFFESWSQADFVKNGLPTDFVQDNHSFSQKGVLRGLHFQNPPSAQGKLVRCVKGRLWDVAVDVRQNSPTFKQWFSIELSAEAKNMIYIPIGFAHGFYALEDCEMLYKVHGGGYDPASDSGILWNDPEIGVAWPLEGEPTLSEKDKALKPLSETNISF
ncbi:MAG: dTDP-4-dehydrorhamnose 3,5-epimerase [Candidatus Kerfeldbacteria bacterium CG15_BIG_FIL_POST_REV_8_21_14_020_45_12]|uniref:dTDP-4-dehydrorhamnose 3,5-epimerase n=1 Tax=Candidatus Kerfeldbacteria bacterium CG15_BIG_FIL_POST_REV_8_21_14_020_45_12 TaxID=2014247 RepID=A0A2M7H3J4_9BACT|nr:MAG: dTDP-4-dehydrorhamnose 3,5-epimerase [Candidatus Kerfeldbacteria bacterium CG15_BIG_FIL_POST_REV_8_21_14_020_45_12]PJA93079.1 MAG: dTDP-4-dehydrorhamnose 3,5-epimerase [Candidatus Kerfeldbacteria bacterium CG_4_9_14_3_um_filter_45_8]